jgi:predicted nucleotidyltransferase
MVNNSLTAKEIIKEESEKLIPNGEIILFGSRARGDATISSDYDFLIVTKDAIPDPQKLKIKALLRKQLAKNKIPADIIISSRNELRTKKEITEHIIRQILKEGVRL